ncbi:MAG: oligosaccharide flippase family protein [Bacteroidetes bacterium]|nr:oligosaccharide flippase family protein [Bacteroidota bacterium]
MSHYWIRSGFFTLLEKGAALVFSLGTAMLLLRLLDKPTFAAWGIFTIIGYFVEMGRNGLIQNGLVRALAIHKDDKKVYADISTASFVLNLAFSLVSSLVLWSIAAWLARQYQAPQLLQLLPVYFALNIIMAPYAHFAFVQQANFEFRGIFGSTFFYRGALFVWIAGCWLSGRPVQLPELAVAMLVGALLGSGVGWYFARPFLVFSGKPELKWIKHLLGYGQYVLGTNLSTMFYKNIDKLSLGYLLGPAAFAVYDAAGKVTQMVEAPSFSIAAVVFPKSAERMALDGAQGVKALYEQSVAAILAIILPFLLGVLVFAEPIIGVFAGPQYADSADVLRLTAFFGLFMPFAVQFGTVMDSTGRPALNFVCTLFTALLNWGLSIVFVRTFGLFGAAFATLAGYAVSFVVMQYFLYKYFKINALRAFGYVPKMYGRVLRGTSPPGLSEGGGVTSPLTFPDKDARGTRSPSPSERGPGGEVPCQEDVIFFTLFRTDNPYSSISLSMAKELAKKHRVFYVNHPYSLKDIVQGWRSGDAMLRRRLPRLLTGRVRYEALDSIPQNFIAVQPPATLPINWLPPGRMYNLLQRWNNGIILRAIRKTLRKYAVRNYVYINCYDPFYAGSLPDNMGARCRIYHCIDDITQNAYTDRHGTALENEACRTADLTFVTSTNLYKLKAPYARRITTYFNAADISVFRRVREETFPRPAELSDREGKVIGFIGNLDELRIDYPLLKNIALAFPQHTLLLVGPVNSAEPRELGLDRLPNVIFAGSRNLHDLPPLLQHMDVVLIPFLKNTLTKSIYPLKINEYLAAGKPVVSTTFSDDIRTFANLIYLAEDETSFINQIAEALQENNPALVQQRVECAQSNTWEARIRQLWKEVNEVLSPKS